MLYTTCLYFYALCLSSDPGFVPKTGSRNQQKAVVEELLRLWKFDDQNFCVACMTRKPVRSKHCKRCKRCVAKHDQYALLDHLSMYAFLGSLSDLVIAHGYIIVWDPTITAIL